jgi:hypothetical protein
VTVRLEALTDSGVPDERQKLGYDVIEDSASRPAPLTASPMQRLRLSR